MKILSMIICFLLILNTGYSQVEKQEKLVFNGYYIGKTGKIQGTDIDIYTYLRFYKDGSVYLQAVNSYDPVSISKWFGRYKKFSQNGTYTIEGSIISMKLDNKESKDYQLEGLQSTSYTGEILSKENIILSNGNNTPEIKFSFVKISDTTTLNYSNDKPVIKIKGEWKVKQIIKKSRQVIFCNEDSTDLGIAVHLASSVDGYSSSQTPLETALAYYEWDSKFMRDELKMSITKISEDKNKAFVIWYSTDKFGNLYYLFGRSDNLVYNIMVRNSSMTEKKITSLLEEIYDLIKH
jgi:hypothetical protein